MRRALRGFRGTDKGIVGELPLSPRMLLSAFEGEGESPRASECRTDFATSLNGFSEAVLLQGRARLRRLTRLARNLAERGGEDATLSIEIQLHA
jgi:hypothetical protein